MRWGVVAAVGCSLVLSGCAGSHSAASSSSAPASTPPSVSSTLTAGPAGKPVDLRKSVLTRKEIGAPVAPRISTASTLDFASNCATTSDGVTSRLAQVSALWGGKPGKASVVQVIAAYPAGKATQIFANYRTAKASQLCEKVTFGGVTHVRLPFERVPNLHADDAYWVCYSSPKVTRSDCSVVARVGDTITAVLVHLPTRSVSRAVLTQLGRVAVANLRHPASN